MLIDNTIREPRLIKINSICDDRGYLIPFSDDLDDELFKRSYIVGDFGTDVIRGLHYHKKEAKVFIIASGAAKFVTLKLPENIADNNDNDEILDYISANPNDVQTFVMSNRHHAVLYVPTYYANGWISLEDNTVLFALGSVRFEEAKDDDIRIDPYLVGDTWNVIGR